MSDDKTTVVEVTINKFPEDALGRIALGGWVGVGLTFGVTFAVALLALLSKLVRATGLFS